MPKMACPFFGHNFREQPEVLIDNELDNDTSTDLSV